MSSNQIALVLALLFLPGCGMLLGLGDFADEESSEAEQGSGGASTAGSGGAGGSGGEVGQGGAEGGTGGAASASSSSASSASSGAGGCQPKSQCPDEAVCGTIPNGCGGQLLCGPYQRTPELDADCANFPPHAYTCQDVYDGLTQALAVPPGCVQRFLKGNSTTEGWCCQ